MWSPLDALCTLHMLIFLNGKSGPVYAIIRFSRLFYENGNVIRDLYQILHIFACALLRYWKKILVYIYGKNIFMLDSRSDKLMTKIIMINYH